MSDENPPDDRPSDDRTLDDRALDGGAPDDRTSTPAPTELRALLDALKLPQDFEAQFHTQKIQTHVPLRKPHPEEWIRVHPRWFQPGAVLKLRGDRKDDLYLIANALVPALSSDHVAGMTFHATVTRQGRFFLWPVRQPKADGRQDVWAESRLEAVAAARVRWIQLHANLANGAYEYKTLTDVLSDPVWPESPWPDLRDLAFRDRFINTLDHPILDQILRGAE